MIYPVLPKGEIEFKLLSFIKFSKISFFKPGHVLYTPVLSTISFIPFSIEHE